MTLYSFLMSSIVQVDVSDDGGDGGGGDGGRLPSGSRQGSPTLRKMKNINRRLISYYTSEFTI
jgi:hypothetical protein